MVATMRSAASRNGTKMPHVTNGESDDVTNGNASLRQPKASLFNSTIGPVMLILFVPNLVLVLWYTARHLDGSYLALLAHLRNQGPVYGIFKIWSQVKVISYFGMSVVGGYSLFALLLMRILPGKQVAGPMTPKGNVPMYKDNGFCCYVVTLLTFGILTYALKQNGHSPSIIYDKFDEILVTLNLFSLLFCLVLYFKGIYAPSSDDSGSSGNLIFDYYWGTELYPRILGFDVKVFTNCRFGMTVWPLLVLCFCIRSYETYGFVDSIFVSTTLQLMYFTKFFWWESGYMRTIDIMLDRAGFYICWGCLVYIPGLYASVSLYLVNHPVSLGWGVSGALLVTGTVSIAINYIADWQKQEVRNTNGKCLIWGKKPEIIRAKYTTEDGTQRESILLVSGWWGLSRHFHYIPELALALCWTLPSKFHHLMPYSYWIFLLILLTHRSFRDDDKCLRKYGAYWLEYRKRVPSKIIPGIF